MNIPRMNSIVDTSTDCPWFLTPLASHSLVSHFARISPRTLPTPTATFTTTPTPTTTPE